jgi:hypothetical protein
MTNEMRKAADQLHDRLRDFGYYRERHPNSPNLKEYSWKLILDCEDFLGQFLDYGYKGSP